jgi:hypothetical protein
MFPILEMELAASQAVECPLNAPLVPLLPHILNHALFGIKTHRRKLKALTINLLATFPDQHSTAAARMRSLNARLSCAHATI